MERWCYYPKIKFFITNKKAEYYLLNACLPAPSEQMLSYKLNITTQDFFIFFIDLKNGKLRTARETALR